jgi:hypothetical protein
MTQNNQNKVAFIVKESGVTLFKDGKQYSAPSDFWSYNRILDKLKNRDFDKIEQLFNLKHVYDTMYAEIAETLKTDTDQDVEIVNGEVFVNGKKVYNSVTRRITRMIENGFDVGPLCKFLVRLMKNPSNTAINELYDFMEKADQTIDDEGYIVAYKKVRNDYKDIHSGTVDYHVGNIVSMPRNQVDDDRSRTCSHGLHFCSYEYLKSFGGAIFEGGPRLLLVRVDPADVVSIPTDYNNAKARTCRMEVIDEIFEDKHVLKDTIVHGAAANPREPILGSSLGVTGNVINFILYDNFFQAPITQPQAVNAATKLGELRSKIIQKLFTTSNYANGHSVDLSNYDVNITLVNKGNQESEQYIKKLTLSDLTKIYNKLVLVYNAFEIGNARKNGVAMFKIKKEEAFKITADLSKLIIDSFN